MTEPQCQCFTMIRHSCTHHQRRVLLTKIAREIDPCPIYRRDKNWNGEGSPLWQHYHATDVPRIKVAFKRAKCVINVIQFT